MTTNVVTYLVYEDLFKYVEKGGLTLPVSCLDDESTIDELIDELIKDMDPVEAISYSSFLNMIVQTCDPEESARLGARELAEVGFKKDIRDNKVFFHRDCLLHMMSRIIMSGQGGTMRITGGSDRHGTRKYYKALLLINSKINRTGENDRHTLLKDYFVRDYPPYYSPKTTGSIIKNRLKRYWYIYGQMLPRMDAYKAEIINKGINALENDSGLILEEHYLVLAGILGWFLILPVKRQEKQNEDISALGFDYKNINSFYIRKKNFPDTNRLICLIEYLTRDIKYIQ
jgi:hypothetical protein